MSYLIVSVEPHPIQGHVVQAKYFYSAIGVKPGLSKEYLRVRAKEWVDPETFMPVSGSVALGLEGDWGRWEERMARKAVAKKAAEEQRAEDVLKRQAYLDIYQPKFGPLPPPKPKPMPRPTQKVRTLPPPRKVAPVLRCPFCHDTVRGNSPSCKACAAYMHHGCWKESYGVCSSCGAEDRERGALVEAGPPDTPDALMRMLSFISHPAVLTGATVLAFFAVACV